MLDIIIIRHHMTNQVSVCRKTQNTNTFERYCLSYLPYITCSENFFNFLKDIIIHFKLGI